MTQYKKMQEEMASAIEDLIWRHHFKATRYENVGWLPQVERGCDSYMNIMIQERSQFDRGNNTLTYTIRAHGSVCQMNPNSDTVELRHAAEEIRRGAELIDAINALGLTYTTICKPQINGAILDNDGKALPNLLNLMGVPLESGTFRHMGGFEFQAKTRDGRKMHIAAEPADPQDEEYRQIRITALTVF